MPYIIYYNNTNNKLIIEKTKKRMKDNEIETPNNILYPTLNKRVLINDSFFTPESNIITINVHGKILKKLIQNVSICRFLNFIE